MIIFAQRKTYEEETKKVVKEVFTMVQEENSEFEEEIEEIHRLGKF